jgi:hypothetical protein
MKVVNPINLCYRSSESKEEGGWWGYGWLQAAKEKVHCLYVMMKQNPWYFAVPIVEIFVDKEYMLEENVHFWLWKGKS